MTWLWFVFGLLVGAAAGVAWGWLWARSRGPASPEAARDELSRALTRAASAEAQRDAARERATALESDRDAMVAQFRSLSQDTLDEHGHKAEAAAQQRFEQTNQLLAPVAESLREVNERLLLTERERARENARLRAEVESMRRGNESLSRQTAELVTALRKPQVRGAWGETQLRRVAELAGMVAHCDFEEQTAYRAESGGLRPDMRVALGGGRELFVDAKTPLAAFLDAAATTDPDAVTAAYARFARHVKTHVDQLSEKRYWALSDEPGPEFVVLFLPGEGFLQAALDGAPDLYDHAARRGVVIATPSTLIALLRTVALGWRQLELAENAAEVAAAGRELYERLATANEHLGRLGTELNSAVAAYNRAVGSLESRVFPSARRFRELGVVQEALPAPAPLQQAARPLVSSDWDTGLKSVRSGG